MPDKKSLEEKLRNLGKISLEERLRELEEKPKKDLESISQNLEEKPLKVDMDNLRDSLKEVNSHLFLPKGRYKIDFDIMIKSKGTLEIEAGTELYFSSEAGIISKGILKALGKYSEKISFTAQRGHWKNIHIEGRDSNDSILKYCTISRGQGRRELGDSETKGGGIHISYSDAKVINCTIKNNYAKKGGGLYLDVSNSLLEGNTIQNNIGERAGGGLYLYNSNATLKKNIIKDHKYSACGAGLFLYNSNVSFEENTIEKNKAKKIGGGLCLSDSDASFKRNIIINNTAVLNGGGIDMSSGSNPSFELNDIRNNSPDNIFR